MARLDDDDAQLVNFGIKASVVKNLLNSHNVKGPVPSEKKLNKRKFSDQMQKGTVLLSCWMTVAKLKELINQESGKVFYPKYQD